MKETDLLVVPHNCGLIIHTVEEEWGIQAEPPLGDTVLGEEMQVCTCGAPGHSCSGHGSRLEPATR